MTAAWSAIVPSNENDLDTGQELEVGKGMTHKGLGETPDCQDALKSMYEFLDKELEPTRRDHVQTHLDECLPCLEAFEFETELKAVIASKCKDDVPAHLYEKVRISLRAEIDGNPPAGGIPTT